MKKDEIRLEEESKEYREDKISENEISLNTKYSNLNCSPFSTSKEANCKT